MLLNILHSRAVGKINIESIIYVDGFPAHMEGGWWWLINNISRQLISAADMELLIICMGIGSTDASRDLAAL